MSVSQLITIENPLENDANIFLLSKNVKVFPCAYRGHYGTYVFDPESRGFTEYNYCHLYNRTRDGKACYLISWEPTGSRSVLKCVIGGYYFELYNLVLSDFWDNENKKIRGLALRLNTIDLTEDNPTATDGERKTQVIMSWHGVKDDDDEKHNDLYLDSMVISDESERYAGAYIFTGLTMMNYEEESRADADYYFTPFTLAAGVTEETATVEDLVINWGMKTPGDVLDTDDGTGAYALRTLGETNEDVSVASGNYSTAFGRGTEATAESAVTLGTITKASAKNAVAIGDHTEATAENSVASGEYSKTVLKNQVVLGQYNDYENGVIDNAPLVVGWGTDTTMLKNIFVLKDNGDLEIKGNLKLVGTITTCGEGDTSETGRSNTLTLGSTTEGEWGAIDIYGKGSGSSSKIFSVSNIGDINTKGSLTVADHTQLNKGLDVLGDVNAHAITTGNCVFSLGTNEAGYTGEFYIWGATADAKVFHVTPVGNVSAAGTLEVTGATTLDSTLDVTGFTNLNAGAKITGNLEVTGNETIGGNLEAKETTISKLTNTGNGTVGGTLKVTGKVTAEDELEAKNIVVSTDRATISDAGAIVGHDSITIKETKEKGSGGTRPTEGNYFVANSTGVTTVGEFTGTALNLTRTGATSNIILKEVGTSLGINVGLNIDGGIVQSGNFAIKVDDTNVVAISTDGTGTFTGALSAASLAVGSGAITGGSLTVTGDASAAALSLSDALTVAKTIKATKEIESDEYIKAPYFVSTSDIRKKCNIEDFVNTRSILDLPIKEYEYIGDASHMKHIGFIAQDLQQVYPELVHEGSDGYLTIEESKLVYLLMKEVKELKQEIKALKGE